MQMLSQAVLYDLWIENLWMDPTILILFLSPSPGHSLLFVLS